MAGGDSLVAHRGVVGPGTALYGRSTRPTCPECSGRSRPGSDGARIREDGGVLERPASGSIPDAPGSYQFRDRDGRIIYVGKAKSLRSRIGSYFARADTLHHRTRQMVEAAASVEWIEVRNEVEALFLEHNLIKRHHPRFNIDLKDDKSYPYLGVTLDEDWPRAMVMRGAKRKGVRYFGPYAHAWAIRETLDALLRTFPIRTCTPAKFQRHARG